MIIEDAKIILLHPGKTGGTSIEHHLKDLYFNNYKLNPKIENQSLMFGFSKKYKLYLQHADLRFLKNYLNKNLNDYKTITSVRNPYDRLVSCYFYNAKDKKFTFEDFVSRHLENLLASNADYAVNHFCPQLNFCKLNNYKVNHLIRLENFNNDCDACGFNIKNNFAKTVKRKKDYNIYYNNKTKDIVYNLYKEDFKFLGYSK